MGFVSHKSIYDVDNVQYLFLHLIVKVTLRHNFISQKMMGDLKC